jgi:hypothetical protein
MEHKIGPFSKKPARAPEISSEKNLILTSHVSIGPGTEKAIPYPMLKSGRV